MFKWLMEYRPIIVAWVWIALTIPAFLWWSEAIWFVIAMSLYANIEASFATHATKKGEREMMCEIRKLQEALGIEEPAD